jgi:hypothetical protein
VNRLSRIDRVIGEPVRRYEHEYPGSLVHADVKKLGNVPDGGGRSPRAIHRARLRRDADDRHRRPGRGGARYRLRLGRKPELARLLIETAISGTDQAIPAEQRDYVQAI